MERNKDDCFSDQIIHSSHLLVSIIFGSRGTSSSNFDFQNIIK